MKNLVLLCFLIPLNNILSSQVLEQHQPTKIELNKKTENIIIITTDGFRWQEVFKGMDSTIAEQHQFNQNRKETIYKRYGAATKTERRKKLLPFIWNTIATQGQIYGNRLLENKVNVSNRYWFSYPGYSEIFCGWVDTLINSNHYKANPNTTLLSYINKQVGFRNKVAAICEWDAFDNILNKQSGGVPVFCGKACPPAQGDSTENIIKTLKNDSYLPFDSTSYLDVFTQYSAMDYMKKNHPRVLYISYGETDEWAHEGRYLDYLDAAHRVDKWLGDIWNFIQNDSVYKNKTTVFITVDHGRGDAIKNDWTSHNSTIIGSDQIWFAVIGNGISPVGEMNFSGQIYQRQFAQTLAHLLGLEFQCEHPVGEPINLK